MNATLTKSLKTSTKTIHGQVLLNGVSKITLVVIDKNGNKNIKGFTKSEYAIRYH